MVLIGDRNQVVRKALVDSLSLPAFILFFTMMGFGSLMQNTGYHAEMAALATLLIWGLPGQLAMVELTGTGQGLIAIVFALVYAILFKGIPTRVSCRWWFRSFRRCSAPV